MTTLVEHVRHLIKQNKMEVALEALEKWAEGNDSDLHNTVIIQAARLNQLRRNERMGILSREEAYRTSNQIRYAVLSIVEELPKDAIVEESPPVAPPIGKSPVAEDPASQPHTRKLFISYAREDIDYVKGLEKHLKVLIRSKHIDSWSDSQLLPGQEWNQEIQYQIEAADIILLMISADFLSSDYINDYELVWAEKTRIAKGALIVPVLVRPCYWQGQSFAKYGALPTDDSGQLQFISQWADQDHAFYKTVEGIRRIIDSKG